ncbi:hypothetical protein GOODEAATRI_025495 [Goodea atripinnis]|uniref:Uncharacterized protein n=1 Tax=Goodea atripinnis TaxID=208336 RepID=A0ABV0Q1W3_9TELE
MLGDKEAGGTVECCALGDLLYIKASIACGRVMDPAALCLSFHTSWNIVLAPWEHFASCSRAQIDKLVHKDKSVKRITVSHFLIPGSSMCSSVIYKARFLKHSSLKITVSRAINNSIASH